jgi:hypothetical protein
VDAFQRTGEGKRIPDFSAASFSGREAKNRSQSLAAREKAVAHRSVKRTWFRVRFWQIAIERVVDLLLPGSEIRFQIHFDADVDCSRPSASVALFFERCRLFSETAQWVAMG